MLNAAVPGANASAARAGSLSAAVPSSISGISGISGGIADLATVRDAVVVRLCGAIDGVGISVLVAVLLIGLILISAGCGPPN